MHFHAVTCIEGILLPLKDKTQCQYRTLLWLSTTHIFSEIVLQRPYLASFLHCLPLKRPRTFSTQYRVSGAGQEGWQNAKLPFGKHG